MAGERKAQILREALRLFSMQGYDSVTIKQLAGACGVTEPALYRHYPSKEAIYNAVLDSMESALEYQELFARLEKENRLEVILFELAEHILSFFRVHRELYRLVLYSALREHEKARQVFRSVRGPYVQFLHEKLDRLSLSGAIKRKNNEISARCFVGMVFDCTLSSTLWRGYLGRTFTPEEIIANNVPIFIDGLSAGEEAAGR